MLKQGMLNSFLLLGGALLGLDSSSAIIAGPQFDAQKKVIRRLSTSLDRKQRKVEAWGMFETSLARIQGDVLDIARGRGVGDKSAQNLFWEMNSPIRSMIKFPTLGWRNISLFWTVILPTLAFFLWDMKMARLSNISIVVCRKSSSISSWNQSSQMKQP